MKHKPIRWVTKAAPLVSYATKYTYLPVKDVSEEMSSLQLEKLPSASDVNPLGAGAVCFACFATNRPVQWLYVFEDLCDSNKYPWDWENYKSGDMFAKSRINFYE